MRKILIGRTSLRTHCRKKASFSSVWLNLTLTFLSSLAGSAGLQKVFITSAILGDIKNKQIQHYLAE